MGKAKLSDKRAGRIEMVPLGKMRIAANGQRALKQAHVDRLAAKMDPDQLGTPEVNHRGGAYYIMDGQHRVEALKQWLGAGWEDQRIECRVYDNLSEAQEAAKFDRLNTNLGVSVYARFWAQLRAGEDEPVQIAKLVERAKLCISLDDIPGAISAVGTIRRIYSRAGSDVLYRTLCITRDAFGDPGLEAPVMDGLSHLCQRYNGAIDDREAVLRLGNMRGGVKGLIGRANVLHEKMGGTLSHCIAAAAVDVINQNRAGKNKVPSWWKTE